MGTFTRLPEDVDTRPQKRKNHLRRRSYDVWILTEDVDLLQDKIESSPSWTGREIAAGDVGTAYEGYSYCRITYDFVYGNAPSDAEKLLKRAGIEKHYELEAFSRGACAPDCENVGVHYDEEVE